MRSLVTNYIWFLVALGVLNLSMKKTVRETFSIRNLAAGAVVVLAWTLFVNPMISSSSEEEE